MHVASRQRRMRQQDLQILLQRDRGEIKCPASLIQHELRTSNTYNIDKRSIITFFLHALYFLFTAPLQTVRLRRLQGKRQQLPQ